MFAILVTAVVVSGCLLTYDPDSVEFQPTSTVPQVIVLRPDINEGFDCKLQIRLDVRNITLTPHWGAENVDGEGHLHFVVGDFNVPDDPNLGIDQPNVDIPVHPTVSSGPQSLQIFTHQNNHDPFEGVSDISITWIKTDPADPTCGDGGS